MLSRIQLLIGHFGMFKPGKFRNFQQHRRTVTNLYIIGEIEGLRKLKYS